MSATTKTKIISKTTSQIFLSPPDTTNLNAPNASQPTPPGRKNAIPSKKLPEKTHSNGQKCYHTFPKS